MATVQLANSLEPKVLDWENLLDGDTVMLRHKSARSNHANNMVLAKFEPSRRLFMFFSNSYYWDERTIKDCYELVGALRFEGYCVRLFLAGDLTVQIQYV